MVQAAEDEMGINDYRVEPATNQCMTDFFLPDTPTGDDIEARTVGDKLFGVAAEELPLNYYDNDDGFWDEYIATKQRRGEEAGFIVNRRHFMH